MSTSTFFVRLRPRPSAPDSRTCGGITFIVGRWMRNVPAELAEKLRGIRQVDSNPDSPLLFDVVDEAGARGLEHEEIERAERLLAAKSGPSRLSQVDRALAVAPDPVVKKSPPAPAAKAPPAQDVFEDEDLAELTAKPASDIEPEPESETEDGEAGETKSDAGAEDEGEGEGDEDESPAETTAATQDVESAPKSRRQLRKEKAAAAKARQ